MFVATEIKNLTSRVGKRPSFKIFMEQVKPYKNGNSKSNKDIATLPATSEQDAKEFFGEGPILLSTNEVSKNSHDDLQLLFDQNLIPKESNQKNFSGKNYFIESNTANTSETKLSSFSNLKLNEFNTSNKTKFEKVNVDFFQNPNLKNQSLKNGTIAELSETNLNYAGKAKFEEINPATQAPDKTFSYYYNQHKILTLVTLFLTFILIEFFMIYLGKNILYNFFIVDKTEVSINKAFSVDNNKNINPTKSKRVPYSDNYSREQTDIYNAKHRIFSFLNAKYPEDKLGFFENTVDLSSVMDLFNANNSLTTIPRNISYISFSPLFAKRSGEQSLFRLDYHESPPALIKTIKFQDEFFIDWEIFSAYGTREVYNFIINPVASEITAPLLLKFNAEKSCNNFYCFEAHGIVPNNKSISIYLKRNSITGTKFEKNFLDSINSNKKFLGIFTMAWQEKSNIYLNSNPQKEGSNWFIQITSAKKLF